MLDKNNIAKQYPGGERNPTLFQSSIEFRPTLQAQHHDAAAKHQTGRAELFTQLLNTLGPDAS